MTCRCEKCEFKSCERDPDRHACLPDNPFDETKHIRGCHPYFKPVIETMDYTKWNCPLCNTSWTEYEDDMK